MGELKKCFAAITSDQKRLIFLMQRTSRLHFSSPGDKVISDC